MSIWVPFISTVHFEECGCPPLGSSDRTGLNTVDILQLLYGFVPHMPLAYFPGNHKLFLSAVTLRSWFLSAMTSSYGTGPAYRKS
jgi:hypothetical protein